MFKLNIRKIIEEIGKTIILSVTFTLISIIVLMIYFLGFFKGYTKGSEYKDNNNTSASLLVITPVPTGTPSPIINPRIITEKKSSFGMKVSWGGPELWEAVNKRRVEFGVNPLNLREEICTIASIRLNELLALGKLDAHEGFTNMPEKRPDLKWIFDEFGVMAEFLAVGGKTPEETVSLWENTLGHKQLLTGGEYVWGCIYSQNTFAVAITAY